MPRPTSAPERTAARPSGVPVRVVLVTMDSHIASAAERAAAGLQRDLPGLRFTVHAASEWSRDDAPPCEVEFRLVRGGREIGARPSVPAGPDEAPAVRLDL